MIVLCIWITIATVVITNTEATYSVLMVPGDASNQLLATINRPCLTNAECSQNTNSEYICIYFNVTMLIIPSQLDCLVDDIKLSYDSSTRLTQDMAGVEIAVPGFGKTETVENMACDKSEYGIVFKPIADRLVLDFSLERHVTLLGCPYDFRKAVSEQKKRFKMIKNLIECTFDNTAKSMVIIAHSMGATLMLQFLQDQTADWKQKYVRAFITISGVFGGTPKSLKVYTAIGEDLGYSDLINGNVLRKALITFPSLAFLLPNSNAYRSSDTLIQSPNGNITIQNYKVFFEAIQFMDGYEMYVDSLKFMDNGGPGVESFCLYGSNIPTLSMLKYTQGDFLNEVPEIVCDCHGDGTVHKRSLEACRQWRHTQSQPVHTQDFPNVKHFDMLSDKDVLDYIIKIMKDLE